MERETGRPGLYAQWKRRQEVTIGEVSNPLPTMSMKWFPGNFYITIYDVPDTWPPFVEITVYHVVRLGISIV